MKIKRQKQSLLPRNITNTSNTKKIKKDEEIIKSKNSTSLGSDLDKKGKGKGKATFLSTIDHHDIQETKETCGDPNQEKYHLILKNLYGLSSSYRPIPSNIQESMDSAYNIESQENTIHLILRQFDLIARYGPTVGFTRLKRWQRAEKLGLNPPEDIKNILESKEAQLYNSYKQPYSFYN